MNKDVVLWKKERWFREWGFNLTLLPTVHQLMEFVLWNGNRAIKKKKQNNKRKKEMQQTSWQDAWH